VSPVYQQTTPTIKWCGIDVPMLWRCGNRGNVASALIEKPAKGDFLPILDGGYSEQYSPLMEYREGKGLVLFCQIDVNGRTESDPAAAALVRNLVRYADGWKPAATRTAVYVGEAAGKRHLEFSGIPVKSYSSGNLSPDQVLIVGPDGGRQLAADSALVAAHLKAGGRVLAIGLDEPDANSFLSSKVTMQNAEHIAAFFPRATAGSLLAGVGPADIHDRTVERLPLVTARTL
jgi:hypothetical protein